MLAYRNPAEKLFNKLSSESANRILGVQADQLQNSEERLGPFFNFHAKNEVVEILSNRGLYLSPNPFQSHSHPACKMIENHLIYVVLPSIIKGVVGNLGANFSFPIFSCKDSKVINIRKFVKNGLIDIPSLHFSLTSKDLVRYGSGSKRSLYEKDLRVKEMALTLRKKNFKNAFSHDEVHYWSIDEMRTFLELSDIDNFFCSIVVPPEILDGKTRSLNPYIYKYEIISIDDKGVHKFSGRPSFRKKGDILAFYPDGCMSEAYYQPLSSADWLGANSIICRNGVSYGISLHTSILSHHVLHFSKTHNSFERVRSFDGFTHIDLGDVFGGYIGNNEMTIRLSFLKNVLTYIICLKKPDIESAYAKFRQLADDDRELSEVLLIGDVYELMIGRQKELNLKDRSKIKDKLCEKIADLSEALFGGDSMVHRALYSKRAFRFALERIGKFNVTIKCCEIGSSDFDNCGDKIFFLGDHLNDSLLTEQITSGRCYDHSLLSRPYCVTLTVENEVNVCFPNEGLDLFPRRCDDWSTMVSYSSLNAINDGSLFQMKIMFERRRKRVKISRFFVRYGASRSRAPIRFSIQDETKMFVHWVSSAYSSLKCLCSSLCEDNVTMESKDLSRLEFLLAIEDGEYMMAYDSLLDIDVDILNDEFGNPCLPFSSGCQEKFTECFNEGKHLFDECREVDGVVNEDGEDDEPTKGCQYDGKRREVFEDYDNSCVFICLRDFLNCREEFIISELERSAIDLKIKFDVDAGLIKSEIIRLMKLFNLNILINDHGNVERHVFDDEFRIIGLNIQDCHCTLLSSNNMAEMHYKERNNLHRSVGQNMIDLSKCMDLLSFKRGLSLNEQSRLGRFGVKGHGTVSKEGGFLSTGYINFIKKMKESEAQMLFSSRVMRTTIEVTCGFAGSGKSHTVEAYLKNRMTGRFLVISPRVALKNQWEKGLASQIKRKRVVVATLENALQMKLSSFDQIVIDELTLYPPGYLSLLSMLFFKDEKEERDNLLRIICLMDPLQTCFYSEEFTLDLSQDFSVLLRNQSIDYLSYTRRMEKNLMKRLFSEVPSLNEEKKSEKPVKVVKDIIMIKDIADYDCILCASRADKIFFSSYGRTLTFGEAQGLSFDKVIIIVSSDALAVSPNHSVVALTRARSEIVFVQYGVSDPMIAMSSRNFFPMVMYGGPIDNSRLAKMFPSGCSVEMCSPSGHKNMDDMEDKLMGDPFLKSEMCIINPINWNDIGFVDIEVVEPKEKTHLTRMDGNFHSVVVTTDMKSRECREIIDYPDSSEQFSDLRRSTERGPVGDAYRSEAIYPKHSNSDSVTFWAAVKKRLLFSDPRKEKEKFERNLSLGLSIFNLFKTTYKLNGEPRPDLLEESLLDFNDRKTDKAAGTIASHSIRSDIDWRVDDILLFMKTQLCTKMEKRFCEGKAGQTLACFSHKVLVRFSPYCRYIEKKFSESLDDQFYIHQRKDFNQLNEWVKRRNFDGICTESDYEAFDRSQDSIVMAFEYHLLKFYGWPDDLVQDYIWLKCNLGCKLGNFAIMRFTGEFCTFLFNTFCNMAFTAMRYNIGDASICFAGDDMCANRPLRKRDCFDSILSKLTLKAKVQFVGNPTFCGWRLTKFGIFKQPDLVLDRMQIAIEKGNVKNCIDGYAIEASYAYDLGDRLFSILKESELFSHYSVIRLIIKNKNLLSRSIASFFEEKVGSRIGCQLLEETHLKQLTQMGKPQRTVYPSGMFMKKVTSIAIKELKREDLKHISRLIVTNWWMGALSDPLRYSMRVRSDISSPSSIDSNMYMWVRWLLASLACSKRKPELVDSSYFSILDGGMQNKLALPGWTSISMIDELWRCLPLTTQCQCLKQILEGLCSCQPNYSVSICMMEVLLSLSTLVYSIVSLMIASQVCVRLSKKRVSFKALKMHLRYQRKNCRGSLVVVISKGLKKSARKMMDLKSKSGRVLWVSNQDQQGSVGSKNTSLFKSGEILMLPYLSHDNVVLKVIDQVKLKPVLQELIRVILLELEMTDVSVRQMMTRKFQESVKGDVMMKRRAFVLRSLYSDFIRKGRDAVLPAWTNFSTWNADNKNMVNVVFEHFGRFVFGSFASFGFSPMTSYPDEPIKIPQLTMRINDADVNIFGDTETFTLQDIAMRIKTQVSASTDGVIRSSTWRNFGECMGPEIYDYGKNHPSFGEFWGTINNALMTDPAPYMGTDAIDGIMLYLGTKATKDEKRVATRFKHWLTVSMNMRSISTDDPDAVRGN